jgi:hypothetical protein
VPPVSQYILGVADDAFLAPALDLAWNPALNLPRASGACMDEVKPRRVVACHMADSSHAAARAEEDPHSNGSSEATLGFSFLESEVDKGDGGKEAAAWWFRERKRGDCWSFLGTTWRRRLVDSCWRMWDVGFDSDGLFLFFVCVGVGSTQRSRKRTDQITKKSDLRALELFVKYQT